MTAMKSDELIEAIRANQPSKVADLLDQDRSLLTARSGNTSAILLAVYHGRPEIARLFVERGAKLSFSEAVALGDRTRAMELLRGDPALLQSYSEDGYPAAGLAIFFRHPELARDLIERGADVNAAARNKQRVAPVHAAASVGDRQSMKLLLERGADPNARQEQGFVPLHSAAGNGDIEMAKLLLEHGADPEARNEAGKTAADIAAEAGKKEVADWLRANRWMR